MKEKVTETKGYRNSIIISKDSKPQKRLCIGIPMTGLLRSEWVIARYGQVIPCNWSQNEFIQYVDQYSPMSFLVADARNIVVRDFVKGDFEWLLFIDHDVVLPPMLLIKLNDYMINAKIPILSGLYFTKSVPSEPLVYRGRGNGYYSNWKLGDKVWVDGLPMGCTLIHNSIIKTLYEESEEYKVGNQTVRRVFETPTRVFYDPQSHSFNTQTGTEDLEFCTRIMKNDIFIKAGWSKFQKKKNPFMIDTGLFCYHIDWDGIKYPAKGEQVRFVRKENNEKRV